MTMECCHCERAKWVWQSTPICHCEILRNKIVAIQVFVILRERKRPKYPKNRFCKTMRLCNLMWFCKIIWILRFAQYDKCCCHCERVKWARQSITKNYKKNQKTTKKPYFWQFVLADCHEVAKATSRNDTKKPHQIKQK